MPLRAGDTKIDGNNTAIADVAEALAGARDILAERVNDDATIRAKLRDLYLTKGVIKSKVARGKEEEGAKFKDYFDWTEPASQAPSHRILAIRRGEAEGFLYSRLNPEENEALAIIENLVLKKQIRRSRTGEAGHPGLLQASAGLRHGGRGAHVLQEEGRRGSHPRLRR